MPPATVVNLSRTLGTLSYSRLQCGQAEVLSEFTQRVQLMPEVSRDPMRDAFQEGFDKSKDETQLLSADECDRLTRSRVRTETVDEANVTEDKSNAAGRSRKPPVEEVEEGDCRKIPSFVTCVSPNFPVNSPSRAVSARMRKCLTATTTNTSSPFPKNIAKR